MGSCIRRNCKSKLRRAMETKRENCGAPARQNKSRNTVSIFDRYGSICIEFDFWVDIGEAQGMHGQEGGQPF
jgi:hypothetical protein